VRWKITRLAEGNEQRLADSIPVRQPPLIMSHDRIVSGEGWISHKLCGRAAGKTAAARIGPPHQNVMTRQHQERRRLCAVQN
jgi:hypothetical protein